MINDMASLKLAMEQMDSEDAEDAEAAKDRAAKILSDANMNFAKLAELIEQRRLLLRPRIVANIKKMDQPEILSDATFRDVSASLRREGQSFRQIAEALELNGGAGARPGDGTSEAPLRSEPAGLGSRAGTLAMRVIGYPVRHPIRFLTIALLAVLLFNGLRDLTGLSRRVSGYATVVSTARERWDGIKSSVTWFFEERIMRRSREALAPQTDTARTPPSDTAPPSSSPPPSPPPASAPPPAAPLTGPAATTGRSGTAAPAPSKPAVKDRRQAEQSRVVEEWVPPEIRRRSRGSGRCVGGIGGCYWGGGQY